MKDLTELETLEIFTCAQELIQKLEDGFKFRSFSLVIQDGLAAGSYYDHVHLHIVPREEASGDLR